MIYVTTARTVSLPEVFGIRIQISTGFTGTITCTMGGTNFAVITNPTTGNAFTYTGIVGVVTVTNSATGDYAISILNDIT